MATPVPKGPGIPLAWITDRLAVGPAPMSTAQLESMRAQGVTAVLNLCAEFRDLHEIEAEAGFDVYHLPIPDEEAPDPAALEKALEWLDECQYLGKKVLIHCRHGIGRTGTVLNAYLLRRGLGHRQAAKTLKKLRSKPANFEQWWAVRKYGRKAGRLTVREPSLEFRNLVDLGPFFEDCRGAAEVVDRAAPEDAPRCGRDHDRCCVLPLRLSLIEAVYLSHGMNHMLSQVERQLVIVRAVESATALKRGATNIPCPLTEYGFCRVYEARPLACRGFGLDPEIREALWRDQVRPVLETLSREVFFAFASDFADANLPDFNMEDVVSGKYVQGFFHLLMAGA